MAISLGGVIGSLARWQIVEFSSSIIGTLIVNILGSAIAALFAYRIATAPRQRLFWITGIAGGFTTFSSLAVLTTERSAINGGLYVIATLLPSLFVVSLIRTRLSK